MKLKEECKLIIVSFLVFISMVIYGFFSEGTYQYDDVTHFYLAKKSWKNPENFLSVWGRPAYTIAYSLPAQFGFFGARIFTSLLAASACFLSGIIAKYYRIDRYFLVPVFVAIQPLYLMLSFSFLTETIFSFFLVMGLLFLINRHYVLSSVFISFLPLTRHEGVVFILMWIIMLIINKRSYCVLLLFLPMALWNIVYYISTGDFPFEIYLNPIPTTKYGFGSPLHYVFMFPFLTGISLLFLFEIGFVKILLEEIKFRWEIVLTFIIYFLAQSIIYAKGSYASGGYLRFLAVLSPIIGIISLEGYNHLLANKREKFLDILLIFLTLLTFFSLFFGLYNFYEPTRLEKINSLSSSHNKLLPTKYQILILSTTVTNIILFLILKIYRLNAVIKNIRNYMAVLLVLFITIIVCLFEVRPYDLSKQAVAIKQASFWVNENTNISREVIIIDRYSTSATTWFNHFLNIDIAQENFMPINKDNIDGLKSGSILILHSRSAAQDAEFFKERINRGSVRLLESFSTPYDHKHRRFTVYIYEIL